MRGGGGEVGFWAWDGAVKRPLDERRGAPELFHGRCGGGVAIEGEKRLQFAIDPNDPNAARIR